MSFVLWMVGLPCSGKSTIAKKLSEHIPNLAILDGDETRKWFKEDDFTKNTIIENNKRIANIAKLLSKHKVPVCVPKISPLKQNREDAKEIIAHEQFFVVYIKSSIEDCEKRDVKGMYKKARNGEIKNFIGIDSPFEIPEDADLVIDTNDLNLEQCIQRILNYIEKNGISGD